MIECGYNWTIKNRKIFFLKVNIKKKKKINLKARKLSQSLPLIFNQFNINWEILLSYPMHGYCVISMLRRRLDTAVLGEGILSKYVAADDVCVESHSKGEIVSLCCANTIWKSLWDYYFSATSKNFERTSKTEIYVYQLMPFELQHIQK